MNKFGRRQQPASAETNEAENQLEETEKADGIHFVNKLQDHFCFGFLRDLVTSFRTTYLKDTIGPFFRTTSSSWGQTVIYGSLSIPFGA